MGRAKLSKKLLTIIGAIICFCIAGICYERISGTGGIIVAAVFLIAGIILLTAVPSAKKQEIPHV